MRRTWSTYHVTVSSVWRARTVQMHQTRYLANENGIEWCPNDHTNDGEPHIHSALRWESTVSNTEYVGSGFEQWPCVLSKNGIVL